MPRSIYSSCRSRFRPPIDRLTRREFVQESLAVGAGMLLSTRATATTRRTVRERRVIVVGAGFAGLACALELRSGLRRRRSRSARSRRRTRSYAHRFRARQDRRGRRRIRRLESSDLAGVRQTLPVAPGRRARDA